MDRLQLQRVTKRVRKTCYTAVAQKLSFQTMPKNKKSKHKTTKQNLGQHLQ